MSCLSPGNTVRSQGEFGTESACPGPLPLPVQFRPLGSGGPGGHPAWARCAQDMWGRVYVVGAAVRHYGPIGRVVNVVVVIPVQRASVMLTIRIVWVAKPEPGVAHLVGDRV